MKKLLLILLLVPGIAFGQADPRAGQATTAQTDATETFIVTGSFSGNSLVTVTVIGHDSPGYKQVTGVTFSGLNLARRARLEATGGGGFGWIELWYRVSPPVGGDFTVVVNLDGAPTYYWAAVGLEWIPPHHSIRPPVQSKRTGQASTFR
jgi:hypothetical protein